MLDITKCPILNPDNFTVNNNGQILGPNPAELTAFAGIAKNLVENFNRLQSLLNDIKAKYPDKYNVDRTWVRCDLGLNGGLDEKTKVKVKGIREVITKPCIQIGFLGPSNIGKSATLNRLFEKNIASTGKSGAPTSSAVVSYYADPQDEWNICGLTDSQLSKKIKFAIKNMKRGLSIIDNDDDFERSYDQIRVKFDEFKNVQPKKYLTLKPTWEFIEVVKKNGVSPIGEKKINNLQQFRDLVNHSSNPEALSVFCGRSTGLPINTTPKVFELVDVPGVGMALQDDYVVKEYNPRIDAYILGYEVDKYDSVAVKEIISDCRNDWAFSNGNADGSKTKRFSQIISKIAKLGIAYSEAYDSWGSLRHEVDNRFFLIETSNESNNQNALNQADFESLVEQATLFGDFYSAKQNNQALYNERFPTHLVALKNFEKEIRQCLFDGGISSFRNFILYQWPIQIVSEIIAKSESDIAQFLQDASDLNLKLNALMELFPIEFINIHNARVALSGIIIEISKARFSPLASGLNPLIDKSGASYHYTPNSDIPTIKEHFKSLARIGARKILRQIVIDDGLINQSYNYISNKGKFINHSLRTSATSHDTENLDILWRKTLPFKKILSVADNDRIKANSMSESEIIDSMDKKFWENLTNKTGIDELLYGLTMVRPSSGGVNNGNSKIDLIDWVSQSLDTHKDVDNFRKLENLINESVNNLAVDCAEVIKNFLIEKINELINKIQLIDSLCSKS